MQTVTGSPDGTLRLTPPVAEIALAEGSARHVEQRIANLTGHGVTLRLSTARVSPGPDGTPGFHAPSPDGLHLDLFDATVHLGPGEEAVLRSTLVRPTGTPPGVVALRGVAGGDDEQEADGQPLTGFVVVRDGTPPEGPQLAARVLRDEGTLRTVVTLRATEAAGPAVADVRVRMRYGGLLTLIDHTARGLLLWPDHPRRLSLALNRPPPVGPVRVEVTSTGGGAAPVSTVHTVWVWPSLLSTLVVLVGLLIAAALGITAWRRCPPGG